MKSNAMLFFLFVIVSQISIGRDWKEYPHPTMGKSHFIEVYRDSMILLQNTEFKCFVSFDLGKNWTAAMNGFNGNDYPEYITQGKDQNFYARIRDNIYKYSIKDNYWIWLFGGYECKVNKEYEFQVDSVGNIFTYCGFYPAGKNLLSGYKTNNGEPYYPAKMIVLSNGMVINFHSERGTISFIDQNGKLLSTIQILKNKSFLFFSDYFQNFYFHDTRKLFIYNLGNSSLDSIPLFATLGFSNSKIYESKDHLLLFSGFYDTNSVSKGKLLISNDGGYHLSPFDHMVGKSFQEISFIHFLKDDQLILEFEGFLRYYDDTLVRKDMIPGRSFLPLAFVKSKDGEYYYFSNGSVLYKLNNELGYKPLVVEDFDQFDNLYQDNENILYIHESKHNGYYYKLPNTLNWIRVNSKNLKNPVLKYFTDESGVVYAIDSMLIFFSRDKGNSWNELISLRPGMTTSRITSVGNKFYFPIGDSLYVADPLHGNIVVYSFPGYIDISVHKKILSYVYIPELIKGYFQYYLMDSLQAKPELIFQNSDGSKYVKYHNSFWLFNKSGIYNILYNKFYYSISDIPKNSSGNIYLGSISVDDEGYLYALTNTGVFVYKDRIQDQPTSNNDLEYLDSELTIFPNPASSYLRVNAKYELLNIEVINLKGTPLLCETARDNSAWINIERLPPGEYYLKCFFANKRLQIAKFLKIQ